MNRFYLTLVAVGALCACSDSASHSAATDSTTVADLELPNQEPVQPALHDVPLDSQKLAAPANPGNAEKATADIGTMTPAPTTKPAQVPRQSQVKPAVASKTSVAAAPTVPAPRRLSPTIDAGTTLHVLLAEKLCTNTAHQGDELVARMESAITGRDGAEVPAGSMVGFRVVSVTDNSIALTPIAVVLDGQTYALSGSASMDQPLAVVASKAGRAKKGGLFGGLLGAGVAIAAGKDAKTAIAAGAAGAAAGAGVGAATGSKVSCTVEAAHVSAQLSAPLLLQTR